MIMEHVKTLRSQFIRQSLQKNPKDRKFFRSTLYLALTQESEVPCELPVSLCNVSISGAVPNPLRANTITYDYVGAINGSNPFSEVQPGMIGLLKSGKYSKNRVEYSRVNGRIAVHAENLPMIRVDYIPDDPMELHETICSINGKTCDAWNTEYVVPNDTMQRILRYVHEQLVPSVPENAEVSVDDKNDLNK